MIRRPPRSTLSSSSAASDVYKRQDYLWHTVNGIVGVAWFVEFYRFEWVTTRGNGLAASKRAVVPVVFLLEREIHSIQAKLDLFGDCLLYTSDAADEEDSVDLGGRRIIKKKK